MEYLVIQDPRKNHFGGMESSTYLNESCRSPVAQFSTRSSKPISLDQLCSSPSPTSDHRPRAPESQSDWHRWSPTQRGVFAHRTRPSVASTIDSASCFSERSSLTSYSNGVSPSGVSPRMEVEKSTAYHSSTQPMDRSPNPGASADDQRNCKLPSFNSLVEGLERKPGLDLGALNAFSGPSESAWKREESSAGSRPLEPPPFRFGGNSTVERSNYSSPTSMLPATISAPSSPHSYPASSYSPKARAPGARHRAHSRTSSDYMATVNGPLAGRSPIDNSTGFVFPRSHHRTQTLPSFPVPGSLSGHASMDPLQSQIPSQHGRYGHGLMSAQQVQKVGAPPFGHSRTDSVLANTEKFGRFHSGSFYAAAPAGPHQRKRRGNLPKDATKILRQWFDDHLEAPYPGEEVKNMLVVKTGLHISQINNWFINARRRLPRVDTNRVRRETTDVSDESPSRENQLSVTPFS